MIKTDCKILAIAGAECSGKSTLKRYMKQLGGGTDSPFHFPKQVTTRTRRLWETDYTHVHKELFQKWVDAGLFAEHTVYHWQHYGTLFSELDPSRINVIVMDWPSACIHGDYKIYLKAQDDVLEIRHTTRGTVRRVDEEPIDPYSVFDQVINTEDVSSLEAVEELMMKVRETLDV